MTQLTSALSRVSTLSELNLSKTGITAQVMCYGSTGALTLACIAEEFGCRRNILPSPPTVLILIEHMIQFNVRN